MVQRMLTTASHPRGLGWLLSLFCLTTILPIINASTTTAASTTAQATRKILKKEKKVSITGTKPTFLPPSTRIIIKEEGQQQEEQREDITKTTTTSTTDNTNKTEKMGKDKLDFLDDLRTKYSHQPTFLQSVEEIAFSLLPLFEDPTHGEFYQRAFVAMTEPERVISFRVPWMDDHGNIQFNRGWRVEFSR